MDGEATLGSWQEHATDGGAPHIVARVIQAEVVEVGNLGGVIEVDDPDANNFEAVQGHPWRSHPMVTQLRGQEGQRKLQRIQVFLAIECIDEGFTK